MGCFISSPSSCVSLSIPLESKLCTPPSELATRPRGCVLYSFRDDLPTESFSLFLSFHPLPFSPLPIFLFFLLYRFCSRFTKGIQSCSFSYTHLSAPVLSTTLRLPPLSPNRRAPASKVPTGLVSASWRYPVICPLVAFSPFDSFFVSLSGDFPKFFVRSFQRISVKDRFRFCFGD